MLSLLNILAPPGTSTTQTSLLTYEDVVTKNIDETTKAWCLNQNPTEVYSTAKLLKLCQFHLLSYYSEIAISVAISLSVIIIKSVLKVFLTYLAKFQRYSSFNQQSSSLITNLFLTYTFTTFVITFLLQANVLSISFKMVISRFVSDPYLLKNVGLLNEYSDLTRNWYLDIGYQIVINWATLTLLPHIVQPFTLWVAECIAECRARRQKFQRNMDKMIEGSVFQFEDCYANVLMIVSVTLLLSGPMPILMALGTVALGTRYLFWKFYFIRFCKIPPTFDESLNSKVMGILPWAVFLHIGISIYAYGNTYIFPRTSSNEILGKLLEYLPSDTSKDGFLLNILARLAGNWLLTLLLALLLVIYFLKTFLVDIVKSLVGQCKKDKVPTVFANNNQEFTPNGDKDFVNSYRMENNKEYEDIMAIRKWYSKKP